MVLHESNGRATIDDDDDDFWFGFEQEYTLIDLENQSSAWFPKTDFLTTRPLTTLLLEPLIQKERTRRRASAHLPRSWFECRGHQCGSDDGAVGVSNLFAKGAASAGDQIWLARYLLERTAESYDIAIDLHPKPVKGDWNGSGMHANFSNGAMRDEGGEDLFKKICEEFGKTSIVTSVYMVLTTINA